MSGVFSRVEARRGAATGMGVDVPAAVVFVLFVDDMDRSSSGLGKGPLLVGRQVRPSGTHTENELLFDRLCVLTG